MAHKIKEINMRFESINKKATELGLEKRLTDSFTVHPIFIGRDNDVSKIVEMLTTIPTEQAISILPIVGMAGLGKTTLTRNVFNDENIKTHFGTHIWVHVSENFDPASLLKKILTTLTSERVEAESKQVVLKRLQEALGAKTYLLVLDDVRNRNQRKWDDFINSLKGISSVKGNSIIVTTRNTEVASMVQTLPFHELENISEDNCWSIIKAKTFGGGDIPPGFETIGRNIATRCQGLPLAANVVGEQLCGTSKNYWLSIEQWLSDVEGDENNISKILKLSFGNSMPSSLKMLLSYDWIFPEGSHIDRQQQIELWMAEGFLQPDQRNGMETVHNIIFNVLLHYPLVQVVERDDYGVVEESSMHDLNPDFILEASGDNWRRMYVVKSEINKSETLRAESHSHQQSNSRFLRLVRLVVNVKLWVDRANKRVLASEGLRVHKKQKIVRDLNLLADTASEVG